MRHVYLTGDEIKQLAVVSDNYDILVGKLMDLQFKRGFDKGVLIGFAVGATAYAAYQIHKARMKNKDMV